MTYVTGEAGGVTYIGIRAIMRDVRHASTQVVAVDLPSHLVDLDDLGPVHMWQIKTQANRIGYV